MSDLTQLSRREREIMTLIFARGEATVRELCSGLKEPPTPMAVRRMLAILLEKGYVKRRKRGREHIYLPTQSRKHAGLKALRHVVSTFFNGSIGTALATHLENCKAKLTDDEVQRLAQLVEELHQERGEL
jgi:predicted transcriptional regulator